MACDGAHVTVYAPIVTNLQKQRAVAESRASLHAAAAGDAQQFVDDILVVRIFDVCSPNGTGGTEFALRAGIQVLGARLKISAAEIAVAAYVIRVNAFGRRRGKDALGLTVTALYAHIRVDLP